jgi:hypothetical protein
MPETEKTAAPASESQFQQQAEQPPLGLLREFAQFLWYNKLWWITPIVIVLLMVGGLFYLAAVGGGPFIYTLF